MSYISFVCFKVVLTDLNPGLSIAPDGQDEDLSVHIIVSLQRHVGREVQGSLTLVGVDSEDK